MEIFISAKEERYERNIYYSPLPYVCISPEWGVFMNVCFILKADVQVKVILVSYRPKAEVKQIFLKLPLIIVILLSIVQKSPHALGNARLGVVWSKLRIKKPPLQRLDQLIECLGAR